jgi:hypothetical protein
MKKLYFLFTLLLTFNGFAQNVTITKIIETDCSNPFIKTVELYVTGTVDFASDVIVNIQTNSNTAWNPLSASGGAGLSGLGTVTDSFVYLVRDISLMQAEFPSSTFDNTNSVVVTASTNGDDRYQVLLNNVVVDQFGIDSEDGTGKAWEHVDAFAERKTGTTETGSFIIDDWTISAKDFLDDYGTCTKSASGANGALLETVITLGNWSAVLSTKVFSKAELSIYPNPVNNGLVTIKSPLSGVKNIELFDAIGRNVLKTELTAEALDVSELGAGLYLLKVTIGDRSAAHKLIIN